VTSQKLYYNRQFDLFPTAICRWMLIGSWPRVTCVSQMYSVISSLVWCYIKSVDV